MNGKFPEDFIMNVVDLVKRQEKRARLNQGSYQQ